ncbi:uncharacterized protein C18orf63-like isoform X2 [Neocloeon triangulifer]|uniref:uncharacterized protein C18orf63-like isoform X2 n=1 Tax=Neocloeon triangulifer TaxID=2078957 RepID=UPI00286F01FD|nr:uncharacterized protein C18orf63-like isoform X2 [Neocloeon triangulifer]
MSNNFNIDHDSKAYAFDFNLPDAVQMSMFQCSIRAPNNQSFYKDMLNQWRVANCRMLVQQNEHFMAAPIFSPPSGLNAFVVCSKSYAHCGQLQAALSFHGFRLERPVDHFDETTMKMVLEFTMLARLSPLWTQVDGNLLAFGSDFVTYACAIPAVHFTLTIIGRTARLVVRPKKVKLQHLQYPDLEINPPQLGMDFINQKIGMVLGNNIDLQWVNTMPSMKPAKIVKITHAIPDSSPLKTYQDFCKMWNDVYGINLPKPAADSTNSPCGPYVTVKYQNNYQSQFANPTEYTFPALCVRPFPVIYYGNFDHQMIASSFLGILQQRFPKVCDVNLVPIPLQKMISAVRVPAPILPKKQQPIKNAGFHLILSQHNSTHEEMAEILNSLRQEQKITAAQALVPAPPTISKIEQQSPSTEQNAVIAAAPTGEVTGEWVIGGSSGTESDVAQSPNSAPPSEPMVMRILPSASAAFGLPIMVHINTPPEQRSTPDLTTDEQISTDSSPNSSAGSDHTYASEGKNAPPVEKTEGGAGIPDQKQELVVRRDSLLLPTSSFFVSSTVEVVNTVPSELRKRLLCSTSTAQQKNKRLRLSYLQNMEKFVLCNRVHTFNCDELKQWLLMHNVPFNWKCKKQQLIDLVHEYFKNKPAVVVQIDA